MARYETVVEDETVYVRTADGRLEVGDLGTILDVVGGPAWTISYTEREKERYPPHVTADEGLTLDVVDTIGAMTFGDGFVETLAAQPGEPVARADGATPGGGDVVADDANVDAADADVGGDDTDVDTDDAVGGAVDAGAVSPRLGLFVGRLLENLEYGLR